MTDSIAFRGRTHKSQAVARTAFEAAFVINPTVSSLSVAKDTLIGGTPVTVLGTNYVQGMTAVFGGVPSPSVVYVSPTQLIVTVPMHFQLGPTTLTVSRPDGGSATVNFIYEDPEMLCGLRLSSLSSTPWATNDVSTVSTIYLTPYLHGRIALWNGVYWQVVTTPEVSFSLSGLLAGRLYDVFAYISGASVVLELSVPWTNDNTRTTALGRQDGVLVKGTDSTRRYIGTFKTISTTATTDTQAQRFLYSYVNPVERDLLWAETSTSWTYALTTVRGRGGLATARVEFVVGQPSLFSAEINVDGQGTSTGGMAGIVGVGLDVTSSFAPTSTCVTSYADTGEAGSAASQLYRASYVAQQTVGYHAAYWCERVTTAVTVTMFGNHGVAGVGLASHMRGRIFA